MTQLQEASHQDTDFPFQVVFYWLVWVFFSFFHLYFDFYFFFLQFFLLTGRHGLHLPPCSPPKAAALQARRCGLWLFAKHFPFPGAGIEGSSRLERAKKK